MFWILNIKTNEPGIANSVPALSLYTGIKRSTFYEKFGREGLKELNKDGYRICKTKVLKSKRK